MKRPSRKSGLWSLTCGLLATALPVHGCVLKKKEALVKSTGLVQKADGFLDVNDVSILLPAKVGKNSELSGLRPLPSLNIKNALGVEIMPKAHFDSFTAAIRGVTPQGDKIDSGIVLKPLPTSISAKPLDSDSNSSINATGPNARLKRNHPDLTQKEMWRVVSARFDPCSPSPNDNLHRNPGRKMPEVFDGAVCHPQLRLVAQPVLYLPNGQVQGHDYAMHLVYGLDEKEARSLTNDLFTLKAKCGELTTHQPLGLHPCILKQAKEGKDEAAKQVEAILAQYALRLEGAAFMGTVLSEEPWTFFTGLFNKDGTFLHVPISSVRQGDSERVDGKRLSFGNGMYQMLAFKMAGSEFDQGTADPLEGRKDVVVPVPHKVPDDLSLALRTTFQTSTSFKDPTPDATKPDFGVHPLVTDYMRRALRISNPQRHDVFSVDCVSCHKATEINLTLLSLGGFTGTRSQSFKARPDISYPLVKDADAFSFLVDDSNRFIAPRGITSTVDPTTLQNDRYNVINFGYFFDFRKKTATPSVAKRTAMESAHAAHMANVSFLEPKSVQQDHPCDQRKLEICFDLRRHKNSDDSKIICLRKVCPAYAKNIPHSDYALRARKDTVVHHDINPKSFSAELDECRIVAGTVLYARNTSTLDGVAFISSTNPLVKPVKNKQGFSMKNGLPWLELSTDDLYQGGCGEFQNGKKFGFEPADFEVSESPVE